MEHPVRAALREDIAAIQALIGRSARGLSQGYYTHEQTEAVLEHVFGVDSQLIEDGTYFVIDGPQSADGPVAAGGWSARRTLFGGDQAKSGIDARLDPATEPARIRAFFVDPAWARHGLARRLYATCARAAMEAGFRRIELMSTAPGEPLYEALGFTVIERIELPLPGDVKIPLARMARALTRQP